MACFHFYTDRGGHYFYTPEVGGKVDKDRPTQVGRALAQLGITHIPSYSPEARGRMERVFGTLQGRLPQTLRLAGIKTLKTANAWLKTRYIPEFNARFGVAPAEAGTAFVPFVGDLTNILCVQDERIVSKDNTVRWRGLTLQIPEQKHRRHFVKAQVKIYAYPDGDLAIFHGPRLLASYTSNGTLRTKDQTSAA
jgi:hypothetical protein